MHEYLKREKDIKNISKVINSYEAKLDTKVSEVISHMMNYSQKNHDSNLPYIQNKRIVSSTPFQTLSHRSTKSTIQTDNAYNADTMLMKFKKNKSKQTLSPPAVVEKQFFKNKTIEKSSSKKPKVLKRAPEIIPKHIRLNPFSGKNAIKGEQLSQGMLSLLERGKVAKNVDIITAFCKGRPVLSTYPAIFHHGEEKFAKEQKNEKKIDEQTSQKSGNWSLTIPHLEKKKTVMNPEINFEKIQSKKTQSIIHQNQQPQIKPMIVLKFLKYKIVEEENFSFLKRSQIEKWNQIRQMLKSMEKFLKSADADLVYVNAEKLIKFQNKCKKISEKELINCIIKNKGSKLGLIRSMKNKKQKQEMSKELLISFIRRIKLRKKYMQILLGKKVQNTIGSWLRVGKFFKDYKQKRKQHLQSIFKAYEQQQQQFKKEHANILQNKHYEIHIMNKQYMKGFPFLQIYNTEITRVFNLSNPNTHIIFVCPFELPLQTINYYYKIMELEEIQNYHQRVIFMDVDSENKLPLTLKTSAKLYYNSRSLRKIKRKIQTVPSYIVSSYPSEVDIKLSVFLKVPILSGNLLKIKTTKSCIENEFEMDVLPCLKISPQEHNIISLFKMIMNYCGSQSSKQKYVIKINGKYESSGLAILRSSFSSLPEMYSNTTLVEPYYFQEVGIFFSQLMKKGGIVEKFQQAIQAILVSVKIDPDGKYSIEGTFDKISSDFVNIGYFFPQKSINHKILMEKTKKIIEKLISMDHIGHVEITFFKDKEDTLYLENVQLYWTKVSSSLTYFKFLAGGYLNHMGQFMTKINDEFEQEKGEQIETVQPRSYCYLPFLLHFGLTDKQISSFFQLCRISGISFDLQNKYGSTFLLLGEMKSSVGIITAGKQRKNIIKLMNKAVDFVHKQNGHNISEEMLKEKDRRMKEKFNLLSLKERLQKFL